MRSLSAVLTCALSVLSCDAAPGECGGLSNETEVRSELIDFEVVNASGADLFFAPPRGEELFVDLDFGLRNSEGDVLELLCSVPCNCEELQYEDSDNGPCPGCEPGTVATFLPSGEAIMEQWTGNLSVVEKMPKACVAEEHLDHELLVSEGQNVTCSRKRSIQDGSYVVSLKAYRSCDDCACDGPACEPGTFSDPVTVEAAFTIPPTGPIQLRFE